MKTGKVSTYPRFTIVGALSVALMTTFFSLPGAFAEEKKIELSEEGKKFRAKYYNIAQDENLPKETIFAKIESKDKASTEENVSAAKGFYDYATASTYLSFDDYIMEVESTGTTVPDETFDSSTAQTSIWEKIGSDYELIKEGELCQETFSDSCVSRTTTTLYKGDWRGFSAHTVAYNFQRYEAYTADTQSF